MSNAKAVDAAAAAGATSSHGKRPVIIIYPTVPPETVVIPIVSSILGFPLLALLVICCLRRRAQLARERDRRRPVNVEFSEHGGLSTIRLSPPSIHRSGGVRLGRPVSLQRSGERGSVSSRGSMQASGVFPSLEMLDTVVEERSDECEITAFEITSTPDS